MHCIKLIYQLNLKAFIVKALWTVNALYFYLYIFWQNIYPIKINSSSLYLWKPYKSMDTNNLSCSVPKQRHWALCLHLSGKISLTVNVKAPDPNSYFLVQFCFCFSLWHNLHSPLLLPAIPIVLFAHGPVALKGRKPNVVHSQQMPASWRPSPGSDTAADICCETMGSCPVQLSMLGAYTKRFCPAWHEV